MPKSRLYAIDWDDTFTADAATTAAIVRLLRSAGHRVVIVTARQETTDNLSEIREVLESHNLEIGIVFSNRGSKIAACERLGLKVDIWMDNDPTTLVMGY